MDMKIMIKERGGFGKEKLHRKIPNSFGVEWSWEIIPYLKDIDHKKNAVRVVDDGGKDVWDYTTEWCPCCDTEVDIAPFGISFCSNCGEPITPCSMCNTDYIDCGDCPYWENAYNTEAERWV